MNGGAIQTVVASSSPNVLVGNPARSCATSFETRLLRPGAVKLIVHEYDCKTFFVAMHTSSMPTPTELDQNDKLNRTKMYS